ncbi:MAG TPA: SAM-dependent methyltransferase [Trebonia sp.]
MVNLPVLHFFPDAEDPAGIVANLMDALPPGSYLVASHGTADYHDPDAAADGVQAVQRAGVAFQTRSAQEFADLALTGLEVVPPGVVPVSEWRRLEWRPEVDNGPVPPPAEVGYYGVVARKPM